MRRFKLFITVFFRSFCSMIVNLSLLYKGQANKDFILQTAHRLEKGLCIATPKPMWGWDKARVLAKALCREKTDNFAKETGSAVLHAYLKQKEIVGNEDGRMLDSFEKEFEELLSQGYCEEKGGSILLSKDDLMCDVASIERLFYIRHSIRDFDDTEVPIEKIIKAVEIANRCPSACNRQPTKVYVVSKNVWNNNTNDMNQVYNAKQHLIITVERQAFSLDEINDWIVSASVFAGYLSLSLTALGIGSCIIKKGLLNDNSYKKLKRYCCIPQSEKIILEIAIGNYKENIKVPVSNRKPIDQILKVVK